MVSLLIMFVVAGLIFSQIGTTRELRELRREVNKIKRSKWFDNVT